MPLYDDSIIPVNLGNSFQNPKLWAPWIEKCYFQSVCRFTGATKCCMSTISDMYGTVLFVRVYIIVQKP